MFVAVYCLNISQNITLVSKSSLWSRIGNDNRAQDNEMDVWSSNELQWLDLKIGHKDSGHSNGHQGDMLYYSGDTVC